MIAKRKGWSSCYCILAGYGRFRYLILNHEIPAYRIYVLGMGNASPTAGEVTAAKRSNRNRVEISVLKNNLDQLVSTSSNASAPPK